MLQYKEKIYNAIMATQKTIAEMKDIVRHDMKGLYDRGEAESDIREVLQLERSIEKECDRRATDARTLIRGI